jgi:hypothetical protein
MVGMRRREFVTLLGGAAAWPVAAQAQQPPRPARIGYLAPASNPDLQEALRAALRQHGYVEGRNLTIEYRFALGQTKTYEELAAELVRLAPDVIVVVGTPSALAAKLVLGHAIENVIAPLERTLALAEGMVIVGRLGQRRQIGRFRRRQFVHRLVEIEERRCSDAVGAHAEIDFVEIEFEDVLLGEGALDLHRQQRFLDLARERQLVGAQEVLGDLLGDGGGTLRATARCRIAARRAWRRGRCRRSRCRRARLYDEPEIEWVNPR